MSAEVAAVPATTSADLASATAEEEQRAKTEEEEGLEEARLRQQLMARDELESMKLEQQKLEVALAEARSRLEQQDRMLRERQAAQVNHDLASHI